MAKNDLILFGLVLLYFLFYFVKFYSKNSNRKKLRPKAKDKEKYSSDFIFIKKLCLYAKQSKKCLWFILGVIIILGLFFIDLIRLILEYPISFLNKILDVEKENGFEFLRYIIFPMFLAFCFVKYSKLVNINSKVLELIIKFYDKILTQLSNNVLVVLTLLIVVSLSVLPYLFKCLGEYESPEIKGALIYLSRWVQFFTIMLLFILILGTYVLLLDDLKNNQVDSYTIIPIFITSCLACSNIIIKLLTIYKRK